MSRLVIVLPEAIDAEHPFLDALRAARIRPERQTFVSAESSEELVDLLCKEEAEFVLLAGQQPLGLVRPDLSTRTACGRPFYWGEDDWAMLATIHPEAYRRNPAWQTSVHHHLRSLVQWGKAPASALEFAPWSCVSCLETVHALDDDLLPWCKTHA
jgi:hypothetical protein